MVKIRVQKVVVLNNAEFEFWNVRYLFVFNSTEAAAGGVL